MAWFAWRNYDSFSPSAEIPRHPVASWATPASPLVSSLVLLFAKRIFFSVVFVLSFRLHVGDGRIREGVPAGGVVPVGIGFSGRAGSCGLLRWRQGLLLLLLPLPPAGFGRLRQGVRRVPAGGDAGSSLTAGGLGRRRRRRCRPAYRQARGRLQPGALAQWSPAAAARCRRARPGLCPRRQSFHCRLCLQRPCGRLWPVALPHQPCLVDSWKCRGRNAHESKTPRETHVKQSFSLCCISSIRKHRESAKRDHLFMCSSTHSRQQKRSRCVEACMSAV